MTFFFQDNRCREPTDLGRKRGKGKFGKLSYRYNKDNEQCEEIKDDVCLGRNRFHTNEACVHMCQWNKVSGRHRFIVRQQNSELK